MEDLIQALNQTPATEGNLQRIKDLVAQALTDLSARIAMVEKNFIVIGASKQKLVAGQQIETKEIPETPDLTAQEPEHKAKAHKSPTHGKTKH